MKTYSRFILESYGARDLLENAAEDLANLNRQLRDALRKGDKEAITELSSKIRDAKEQSDQDTSSRKIDKLLTPPDNHEPSNPNTWVSSNPSKPRDNISSVGTIPNVAREKINDPRTGEVIGSARTRGVNVSGLHGDTRTRSGGGGSVPTRNKGQGSTRPERG